MGEREIEGDVEKGERDAVVYLLVDEACDRFDELVEDSQSSRIVSVTGKKKTKKDQKNAWCDTGRCMKSY